MPRKLAAFATGILFLLALVAAVPASGNGPEEMTRMLTTYELTMARVEAYGVVLAGIGDWAEAHPEQARALRAQAPQGLADVARAAAVLESEPALKELLDQQHLSGRDFVLIPAAMMQARLAVLGEAQGRRIPADQINRKNLALAKANAARMDAIMHKAATDRIRAFGR